MTIKSVKKAPKATGVAPAKGVKENLKAGADLFAWHGIIDLSLEGRPVLRSLKPGERQLDYAVQTHHAYLPQDQGSQLTLRIRAHISLLDISLVIAEIHYSAVTTIPLKPTEVDSSHQILYPFAREAFLSALNLVGHQPPIPEVLTAS